GSWGDLLTVAWSRQDHTRPASRNQSTRPRRRARGRVTVGTSRTATPATVSALPATSTGVSRYTSRTCGWVGTTTIRPGDSIHGPSAPSACQFGNQDTLTTCGSPTRSVV